MFTDAIHEFLQQPRIARLSTLDADGYPHTVPVWFAVDGGDIVMISVRQTAKVNHIRVRPRGAVSIGGDTSDNGGYLIKGDLSLEEDLDDAWMKKMIYRYESGAQAEKDIAEWTPLDILVIRLKPRRVLKVA